MIVRINDVGVTRGNAARWGTNVRYTSSSFTIYPSFQIEMSLITAPCCNHSPPSQADRGYEMCLTWTRHDEVTQPTTTPSYSNVMLSDVESMDFHHSPATSCYRRFPYTVNALIEKQPHSPRQLILNRSASEINMASRVLPGYHHPAIFMIR